MKHLLLIPLVLFVLSCGKPQREVVVSKWNNGNPKKVNYVIGEGVKQEIVGRITYDENGEVNTKGEYKKGKKHGKHEYYDENGYITKEEYYKDGKKDGKWTRWSKNGHITKEEYYKDLLNIFRNFQKVYGIIFQDN